MQAMFRVKVAHVKSTHTNQTDSNSTDWPAISYNKSKDSCSLHYNKNAKLWFSRMKGSRSLTDVSSMFGIDFEISSSEKGMLRQEEK